MAVVVKYADNILKGFAASFAVVLTFLISMYFSNFYPNQNFYIGAVSESHHHYFWLTSETRCAHHQSFVFIVVYILRRY